MSGNRPILNDARSAVVTRNRGVVTVSEVKDPQQSPVKHRPATPEEIAEANSRRERRRLEGEKAALARRDRRPAGGAQTRRTA